MYMYSFGGVTETRSAWRLYTLHVRTWPVSRSKWAPLIGRRRSVCACVYKSSKFEKEGVRNDQGAGYSRIASVSKSASTQITWAWQREVCIIIGNNRTRYHRRWSSPGRLVLMSWDLTAVCTCGSSGWSPFPKTIGFGDRNTSYQGPHRA